MAKPTESEERDENSSKTKLRDKVRLGRGTRKRKEGAPGEKDPEAEVLLEKWHQAVNAIREEQANYWLNYAFLDGSQWVSWNKSDGRISEVNREDSRARITINRMAPNTRAIVSKATQRELGFEVLPDGADDAHIRAARISETILRTLHRAHDWEVTRERHIQALWKGGTAAICVDWDPTAKDQIFPSTDEGEPATFEGDSVETTLSIAEFCVEPGTRDPEKARYWFKSIAVPVLEAQATYELDWCPPSDSGSISTPYSNRFTSGASPADNKTCLVLTYYERPNFLNKEGRIAVVIDSQIVHDADWPFPDKDRLNLFVGRETVVENKWTGTTILSSARPIQTAINASWSSVVEHMKRAGNARLAVPQSALDTVQALTDTAAEIIPYHDGVSSPPQWISPPQMPGWWVEEPQRLSEQLDDIMGVHDVSRGQAPTNAPDSGYGLSILVEQDTTPIGRMVKETARVWSDVASFVLKLHEQQAKAPRKLSVSVPGQPPMTISWTGKDLMKQTTAHIPPDSIMPRSKAAQMALADKLLMSQLITSPEQYAKVAELPSMHDFMSAVSPDIVRAQRENALMAAEQVAIVKDFDDHEAHIKQHNDFRKSAMYEMLDPKMQKVVDTHVQGHETMAAEELGKRQAGGQINPMLAGAPVASGAPAVDPALTAPPPPDMIDPAAVEAAAQPSEDDIVQNMIAEMQANNPA